MEFSLGDSEGEILIQFVLLSSSRKRRSSGLAVVSTIGAVAYRESNLH